MNKRATIFIVSSLFLSFINIGSGCSDPNALKIPIKTSGLEKCLSNEKQCLMVLSVATKNIPAKSYAPYEESLKYLGYNYEIIGVDQDWHGWITRGAIMKGAMDYLSKRFTREELKKIIIVSSDTGDVLVQRGPADLLALYRGKKAELKAQYPDKLDTENLIVVGGEWVCGGNCEKKATSWFDRLNIEKTKRYFPYAQGGFLMGPVDALLDYYTYTVDFMETVYNDDQIAMGNFVHNYPHEVYIDFQQEIMTTILVRPGDTISSETGVNFFQDKLYKFTSAGFALGDTFSNTIGKPLDTVYPVFLHMPNNTREEPVKNYWDRLVDHLQKTVWKH